MAEYSRPSSHSVMIRRRWVTARPMSLTVERNGGTTFSWRKARRSLTRVRTPQLKRLARSSQSQQAPLLEGLFTHAAEAPLSESGHGTAFAQFQIFGSGLQGKSHPPLLGFRQRDIGGHAGV